MEIARISKEEVRAKIQNPEVILIDVRHDQRTASEKIRGAILEDPNDVERWQDKYSKHREIIVYGS